MDSGIPEIQEEIESLSRAISNYSTMLDGDTKREFTRKLSIIKAEYTAWEAQSNAFYSNIKTLFDELFNVAAVKEHRQQLVNTPMKRNVTANIRNMFPPAATPLLSLLKEVG